MTMPTQVILQDGHLNCGQEATQHHKDYKEGCDTYGIQGKFQIFQKLGQYDLLYIYGAIA